MSVIFAVSRQQQIGLFIAAVLTVGWIVYLFSAARRSYEPGAEVEEAPNRKRYFSDDVLEGPKLDRALTWALVLLGFVAIGLPLYWLREPGRQTGATKGFDTRAAHHGEELFQATPGNPPTPRKAHFGCENCHGPKGVGGVTTYTLTDQAHPDAPPRQVQWNCPPLNTVMLRFRPDEVRQIITYGRANTPMPPWGVKGGGPMNDQQIDDLIAYLDSIKLTPDKAKAQAAQFGTDGKALFDGYCARCHTQGFSYGEPAIEGGGAYGPDLTGGLTTRQFPDPKLQVDWVTNTAELGKAYGVRGVSSGRMPHFGDMLSPEQIQAIVDYERSL